MASHDQPRSTALRSIVCDFGGSCRVRGRSSGAEVCCNSGEGGWASVDGVIQERAAVYEEVGLPMVEDVLSGRNACVFTHGEEGAGELDVVAGGNGAPDSPPGLLAELTAALAHAVGEVNAATESTGERALLQISLFSVSPTDEVSDLLGSLGDTPLPRDNEGGGGSAAAAAAAGAGGTSGSGNPFSVWQDPLRGPVIADVTSLSVLSPDDLPAVGPWPSADTLFPAAGPIDAANAHTIYQATVFRTRAEVGDGDAAEATAADVTHQISNLRVCLLAQRRTLNSGFDCLSRIVDGLADARQNPSLLSNLRGLVKQSVLTYLMSECLGGNCVTTALGFLGTNTPSSVETLHFAAKARHLTGIVGRNASNHQDAVVEILRQIAEAEDRQKHADDSGSGAAGGASGGGGGGGGGGGPFAGSANASFALDDSFQIATPDWDSSIALRKHSIDLLERLKDASLQSSLVSRQQQQQQQRQRQQQENDAASSLPPPPPHADEEEEEAGDRLRDQQQQHQQPHQQQHLQQQQPHEQPRRLSRDRAVPTFLDVGGDNDDDSAAAASEGCADHVAYSPTAALRAENRGLLKQLKELHEIVQAQETRAVWQKKTDIKI